MKVSIRPLQVEDAYTSVKWRNDAEVFRYTRNTYDHIITIDSELEWIKRVISNKDEYRCAIIVDEKYVGNIYLTKINEESAVYQIFIGEKGFWGKGVAREASMQILDYAKKVLGLDNVRLTVREDNIRARQLYKSLGFKEIDIKDNWITMRVYLNYKPLVVIRSVIYNHEPYLRDCIEGIVMQKTNFKFVAIVHDDCSTDNSAAIIREYAEKYPDIIKPIFETENQYSKHDGSLRRIMNDAVQATGAKYVAICEGDDYWTDPLKLQKQVDFLEAHPEYGCCCTRYRYYFQTTGEFYETDHFEKLFQKGEKGIEYNHENYFKIGLLPQILTTVYRTDLFPTDAYYFKLRNTQDDALFYCMTLYSKIWLMNEVMGVYRKHDNSLTWGVNQGGAIAQAKMLHDIWLDCWQYDKSDVLRGTVLWSIQRWCTSTIRYAKMWDSNTVKQCIEEYRSIATKAEQRSFYKALLRALIVRIIKRPYKKG